MEKHTNGSLIASVSPQLSFKYIMTTLIHNLGSKENFEKKKIKIIILLKKKISINKISSILKKLLLKLKIHAVNIFRAESLDVKKKKNIL